MGNFATEPFLYDKKKDLLPILFL